MVTMELRIGQLQREVGFLVVPQLKTNHILGIAFIKNFLEGISLKTGLVTPSNSSPVVTIYESRRDHIVNISVENATDINRNATDGHSTVVSRVTTHRSMSETAVQIKTSCRGIQMVSTHESLVQKRVALVAQSIVDTTPGIPFLIKTVTFTLSSTTLPKGMKVAICAASPL